MCKAIAAILFCLAVFVGLYYEPEAQSVDAQEESENDTHAATEYIAKEGDSWWKLAHLTFRDRGLGSHDIQNANPGKQLTPGAIILIPVAKPKPASPSPGTTVVAAPSGVRLIRAKAGDTQYSLALTYYKDRKRFLDIMNANPSLNWAERLEGGEYVLLPELIYAKSEIPSEKSTTQVVEDGDFEIEVTTKVRQRRK